MNTETATDPATFEVGDRIVARNAVDHANPWTFEVVKRTRCFVTLRDVRDGKTYRTRIQTNETYGGSADEWTLPFGSYSMAPVANA